MTRFGVVPHNRDMPGTGFKAEFPATELVSIHFNQESPEKLHSSIGYHCDLGREVVKAGLTPCWSIPMPGKRQLEAVNRGDFDITYNLLAEEVLKVDPRPNVPILGRLPWEGGFAWQDNAAINAFGEPDGPMHGKASRRISAITRAVWRERARMAFCPEIEVPAKRIVQPIQWWPGTHHVDVIAFDFYLSLAKGHKPGNFISGWFGKWVDDLIEFAVQRGKPIGVWELGFDNDVFAPDARAFFERIKAAQKRLKLEFLMYWQNPDDINAGVLKGERPAIKAEIARAFPEWMQ